MKLHNLLKNTDYNLLKGNLDIDINSVSYDSRKVKANSLFVCVRGTKMNGHDFLHEAIKNGSIAIVFEDEINYEDINNTTFIKVENTKRVLASMANLFYKEPSKEVELIGVTGTNGKTTVINYIKDVLESYGKRVGTIGTLGYKFEDKEITIDKTTPTTPEALELQAAFREIITNGGEDIIMEVTSSALSKNRVDYCDFNIGVFTNLSQDHLEEHGTMEVYKNEKMKLFHKCKLGIINIDDDIADEIINTATCKILTYGIEKDADIKATELRLTSASVTFKVNFKEICREISINVPGKFTVYNILAAIAATYGLGIDIDTIIKLITNIKPVPGRLEMVQNHLNKNVLVDFAHTPDSLEKLLTVAKEITNGKIILVFGCGGNRDIGKRKIMGKIASALSDYCIITSDNPRTEDPNIILSHIEEGIKATKTPYEKFVDRRDAIEKAMKLLGDEDLLVIAGKGHETYQIIGIEEIYFDDREVVKELFMKFKIDKDDI